MIQVAIEPREACKRELFSVKLVGWKEKTAEYHQRMIDSYEMSELRGVVWSV